MSLPIVDDRTRPVSLASPEMLRQLGVPETCSCGHARHDLAPNEIMHTLEQIKMEMRQLVSEVSLLAQEIQNIRRQLAPAPPWRS